MTRRTRASYLALSLVAALACGKEGGDSTGDASTGPTTGATVADSTGTGTDTDTDTVTGTTRTPTDGATGTTDAPTTDAIETTDDTGSGTTGVELAGFDRFLFTRAAGPCPPDADCDGSLELLASGLLRIEPFGEVGNPVTEQQVSDEDLAAAVAVFTDPALLTLLDGPDPLCNPPTDIFESMLVEVDQSGHDASTTACDQPPIAAAREMAEFLAETYLP